MAEVTRTPVGDIVASTEIVEVRGELVRFDCTEGHRFIVDAGDLVYALDIVDLARVDILENGERVGTRDFYCGPLDELVVVRYIPAPVQDGAAGRYGRLVAVDLSGRSRTRSGAAAPSPGQLNVSPHSKVAMVTGAGTGTGRAAGACVIHCWCDELKAL